MKRVFTLVALLAAISFGATAQRICGAMEHHEHLLQTDPNYAERQQEIENFTAQYVMEHANEERAIVTIPVVFHVVYNTAAQNVSTAQIQAQINQLNLDYARLNADWTNTPSVFQPFASDTQIQFCLASVDPNGAATTGIERKQTTTTSFSTNDGVKSGTLTSTSGGLNAWPASSYLNIWVCNQSGGILGYAQFPGGAAATDGVVLHYTTVGSVASPFSGGAPYNLGRTATHEVGHWLNLRHIWGDATCGNDQVADTPTASTANYGCPVFPSVTCSNGPNGDMFMNYMDYTDDACMYMFTAGQTARMQALFATGGARASLLSSNGCGTATTTCGTPASLSATSITTTGATLSWGAVSGATSYNVQYKLSTATTWTSATATTTSLVLSGLTSASTYNYQVQAVCSSGAGSFSTASSFTTASAVTCGNPSGLAASSITSSAATLSWTAVSGATSYNVQYKLSTATTFTTVTATGTSVSLTGLSAASLYNYQVQSVCSAGASSYVASTFTTVSATGSCTDTYESNNTSATAKAIPTNTSINALISTSTDKDWFSFTNTTAARNIRIDLSTLPADYDVRLYNPSGTQVGISQNGSTTAELIKYNTTTVGTWKIQVYGYGGAFSTTSCYTLLVSTSSTAFRESADAEPTINTDVVAEKLEAVVVYPNPTTGEVNLSFNTPKDGAVNISVLDIAGREVYATKVGAIHGQNKVELNLADFSAGYYTVVLTDGVERSTIRVVKN